MKITKYIHSCLVIEKGLDRILFDPGLFSFVEGAVKPNQFQNIQAILRDLSEKKILLGFKSNIRYRNHC
ncbi:MAG: hypothetical protein ACR2HG_00575 [Pyrinomonadaceae bacterium]